MTTRTRVGDRNSYFGRPTNAGNRVRPAAVLGGWKKDVPVFGKSASREEVESHGFVLTPGRYVGAEAAEEDGEPFEEKMQRLVAQLSLQQEEAAQLDALISENLKGLRYAN